MLRLKYKEVEKEEEDGVKGTQAGNGSGFLSWVPDRSFRNFKSVGCRF